MEGIVSLLPLIFIAGVFYFLLIRPQRNRQRQAQEMQRQVGPGQRVMTTAGLFATVVAVDDDGVELEIAPGVTSRWTRAAISRVLPDESAELDALDQQFDEPDDEEGEHAQEPEPPSRSSSAPTTPAQATPAPTEQEQRPAKEAGSG